MAVDQWQEERKINYKQQRAYRQIQSQQMTNDKQQEQRKKWHDYFEACTYTCGPSLLHIINKFPNVLIRLWDLISIYIYIYIIMII